MIRMKGALGATLTLVSGLAAAAPPSPTPAQAGPELVAGLLRHDANFHPLGEKLIFDAPPPGVVYAGDESGSADVQLAYRSAPLRWALKPRLAAKLQLNTAGRTSFASLGAEWRQHMLRGRLYGQLGIGVTIHDGYRFTPDPLAPGLSDGERAQRLDIFLNRTAFGSRVLFNPNASLGLRLSRRYAVEMAWEHFSHRGLFGKQNPGMDHLGVRLVRTLGR